MATDNLLSDKSDSLTDELPPSANPTPEEVVDDAEYEEELFEERSFRARDVFAGVGACGFSMLAHVLLLVGLAVLTFDDPLAVASHMLVATPRDDTEDPPVEVELQEEIETVTAETVSTFSAAPLAGVVGGAVAEGAPSLDMTLVQDAQPTEIKIDAPTIGLPNSNKLIEALPEGDVKGEPRDIVDSYQTAMDRIAQELMWMLDKGPVLAVWCFDQSESMKDDQKELRDRIGNVYNQLGILGTSNSDALLTGVTSYGQGYIDHTQKKPTSNRLEIEKAIDAVPVDVSGEEMMCQAVGKTMELYDEFARRGRQMCIILVTDESGNRDNNDQYLERAVAAAKAIKCKIYILGREAVFGYPYAYMRWTHPETNREHWLQVDRGPETGFPEQLQTNGFHRRHDAFSSGFGPYEEARLARETNGIFFMLPSVETNLVGAQKHHYELEPMRPYRPDLRARLEVFADRDKYPLRTLIWKVIQDLNPHNEQAQKAVELRVEFSLNPAEFVQQARREQQKAKLHLQYLAEAEKALSEGKKLREQEADPRWQANYDLIFAQVVAYQARIYEYGVALEEFLRAPKTAPPMKDTLHLEHWDLHTVSQVRTEEAKPYIDRAKVLFEEVIELHPGTPWAARAQWERGRGFGADIVPDYHPPYRDVTPTIKVPKL